MPHVTLSPQPLKPLVSTAAIVSTVVGIPVVMVPMIFIQDIPAGERYTITGILVLVLAFAATLLKTQGKQLVSGIKANTEAQTANTLKLSELAGSLEHLSRSNAKWKGELLDGIERVEDRLREKDDG